MRNPSFRSACRSYSTILPASRKQPCRSFDHAERIENVKRSEWRLQQLDRAAAHVLDDRVAQPSAADQYAACSSRSSHVLSTNKPFAEWSEVFPHAACTVALVDRLLHRARSSTSKATATASRKPRLRPSPRPVPKSAPASRPSASESAPQRHFSAPQSRAFAQPAARSRGYRAS